MSASVIDEFFVALGFRVDPAGLKGVRDQVDGAKESLLSLGTAFKAFVAGFAIKEIADIGSTFEQNRIQIAGFLSALGLSSDFTAGLRDAEGIIQKITTDAAKLPGEAEEYVEVFKANAAFLKTGLPGSNAGQIADFTNKLTAVAKTVASSLDANQIAREAGMLLASQGRAGGHNVLWTKLLPFLMQLKGQANITAQSFNAMTQPKRVELLQAAFEKLQPMLDASASSFDAMYGAAVSMVKQLTRRITGGLFDQMKRGLDQLNHIFFTDEGALTAFGQNFVDGAKTIVGWMGQIISMGGGFISWLVQSRTGMLLLKGAAIVLGAALAGIAFEGSISMLTKMVKAIGNVKRALMGGLFIALVLIAEDIYTFTVGGESLTGMLVNKLGPALSVIVGIIGTLTLAFAALRPAVFLNTIGLLIGRIGALVGTLVGGGFAAAAAWMPMILMFAAIALAAYGVVKAIDALDAKFEGFRQTRMKVRGALGLANDDEKAALSANALDRKVADPSLVWQKWEPPSAGSPRAGMEFSPASAAPAGAASGSGANGQTTQVTIGQINIRSTDPKEAARETAREIARNGQKRYR